MSNEGTITVWLRALREGQTEAAERLWQNYFSQLVGLARQKLQGRRSAAADEEDVALSAFHSFCQGVARGRFPRLSDRDDLWQVLVLLTARKASKQRRRELAQKRGAGAVVHASALGDEEADLLQQVIGQEPSPDFAAELADQFQLLVNCVGDRGELRSIARWRLEGYSNAEIARFLDVAERTVERRLVLIRKLWVQESEHE